MTDTLPSYMRTRTVFRYNAPFSLFFSIVVISLRKKKQCIDMKDESCRFLVRLFQIERNRIISNERICFLAKIV